MLSIRKATAVVDGRAGIETSEEPDQARDNGPQDVPYKDYLMLTQFHMLLDAFGG